MRFSGHAIPLSGRVEKYSQGMRAGRFWNLHNEEIRTSVSIIKEGELHIVKRIGNLYERVFDRANVVQAVYAVCEKKKKTPLIRRVLANAEWYVDEVLQHPYIRGDYRTGIAADSASGKVRNILKPSIHDQIIHHAVIQITGEIP